MPSARFSTSCDLGAVLGTTAAENAPKSREVGAAGGWHPSTPARRIVTPGMIVAMPDAASLAALLGAHPGTLVLTGAGISTDSGIPDYRGPDGTRRVTPMQHGEFVGTSEARQRYWARSFIGWQRFSHAEPDAAHLAVADLQRAGRSAR